MTRPYVLAQISDPHIGGAWGGPGSQEGLEAVMTAATAFAPDVVVVTGDVADHATAEEYWHARRALSRLGAPLHVLPGNHDDRAELRRAFDVGGAGDEPVRYAVELGPLRLVALDSTRPGHDDGELDLELLGWLDGALAAEPAAPTVVALHHPPLVTGAPALDSARLRDESRRGLAEVVARHSQVHRVIAGHVHRVMTGECGGTTFLTAPSTYVQLELDFEDPRLRPSGDPSGFVLHVLADGELVSHVVRV
jgi:3',5'-cyclic AMP phosphodiesterase CpdA